MATAIWLGGASKSAQVDHFTPGGTIEVDDIFIITLTAEDGTTQAEQYTGATTVQGIVEGLQAVLAASTQNLFTAITWTEDDTKVIGTAKVAGVPFSAAATTTETGGGAADAQTFSRAASVANSGPNDWNTTANWSGAAIPVSTNDVYIIDSAHSILYGLDQNAVALASLRVGETFTASIGQSDNSYYLKIDATVVVHSGSGSAFWLNGTCPTVYVNNASSRGDHMLELDGDIDNLHIVGSRITGRVRVKAGAVLDNVYVTAAGARVVLGTSITDLDKIEMTAGTVENSSGVTAGSSEVNVSGGTYTQKDGSVVKLTQRGGSVDYRADGTLTNLLVYSGAFTLQKQSIGALTISNATIWGGTISERSGLKNVGWSADIIQHGGAVASDTGRTVAVT